MQFKMILNGDALSSQERAINRRWQPEAARMDYSRLLLGLGFSSASCSSGSLPVYGEM